MTYHLKKGLHNGRRQSKKLGSSRWTCLTRKILIVIGLVGVVASTQLMPFFLRIRLHLGLVPAYSFVGCAVIFGTWLLRPLYAMTAKPGGLLIAAHKSHFMSIIRHECPFFFRVYSLRLFQRSSTHNFAQTKAK